MKRWHLGSATLVVALVGGLFYVRGDAQETTPPTSSKLAASRIDKVTVYPSNALVTREVQVPAGAGLIELTVSPMPAQIVTSTAPQDECTRRYRRVSPPGDDWDSGPSWRPREGWRRRERMDEGSCSGTVPCRQGALKH
jgi:hypothetical protein